MKKLIVSAVLSALLLTSCGNADDGTATVSKDASNILTENNSSAKSSNTNNESSPDNNSPTNKNSPGNDGSVITKVLPGNSSSTNNSNSANNKTSPGNDSSKTNETFNLVSTYDKKIYTEAYTEFLLNFDMRENDAFPVYGFHLLDLNFDSLPELGVLHHSGGSMGGYFTYYYFDGDDVLPVLNYDGSKIRNTDSAELLAEYKSKKIYLLKEMYLLLGNENGMYGYLREVKTDFDVPEFHNILSLEVDEFTVVENKYDKTYDHEDDYLKDSSISDCLKTEHFVNDHWQAITPKEYLSIKQSLIPDKNDFVSLYETGSHVYLYDSPQSMDFENLSNLRQITNEEIEILFSEWFETVE